MKALIIMSVLFSFAAQAEGFDSDLNQRVKQELLVHLKS